MSVFVHSNMNMTDFVKQFHMCVEYFCFRDVEVDFHLEYGQAML